ncbi:MAG: hypothetical protein ABJC79_02365, partial [Acidimicrobiia bacterium]
SDRAELRAFLGLRAHAEWYPRRCARAFGRVERVSTVTSVGGNAGAGRVVEPVRPLCHASAAAPLRGVVGTNRIESGSRGSLAGDGDE